MYKSSTINPKLIAQKRRPLPPTEPPPALDNNEIDDDDSEDEDGKPKRKVIGQQSNDLLHTGTFIQKEYVLGKLVPNTGLWTCCGENDNPLYCSSIENRRAHQRKLKEIEKVNQANIEYAKKKEETLTIPWKNKEIGHVHEIENDEDRAMNETSGTHNSFNAPMLISWLMKHETDEPTVLSGLKFIYNHCETGEGCAVLMRHSVIGCIIKIHETYFKTHPPIQLQCLNVLNRLLDCNLTRDEIISTAKVVRAAFNMAHYYMNSKEHVNAALRCIAQCSRSEICRKDILNRNILPYIKKFVVKYHKTASIVRSSLKLYNWTANNDVRLRDACNLGIVPIVVKCLDEHKTNADVLAPGILFLTRSAKCHPPALEIMLKMKALPIIINALRALYSNETLQLEALLMIQTLSRTTEGWQQINDTRGGWQSICQGTSLGDALIHELPGPLNNPGWCIGETPHLPLIDRMKQEAAKVSQSRTQVAPNGAWTEHSLREYMGISMKEQKLAINIEYHQCYFELLSSLDLLPKPNEEREYFFIRLSDYEKESNIKLDEMVQTIIDMRRNDRLTESFDYNKKSTEYKTVYYNGQIVTTKLLEELDLDVSDFAALS